MVSHVILCRIFGLSLDFGSREDLKWLLFRNTVMVVQQLFYTWMYFVIPYPIVNGIFLSGPLFVFILDYYINGVTVNRSQIYGIIVGFFGVMLVINGDLVMSLFDPNYHPHSNYQNYLYDSLSAKILFSFLALASNIPWALAILSQKKIKQVAGIKISLFLGI